MNKEFQYVVHINKDLIPIAVTNTLENAREIIQSNPLCIENLYTISWDDSISIREFYRLFFGYVPLNIDIVEYNPQDKVNIAVYRPWKTLNFKVKEQ